MRRVRIRFITALAVLPLLFGLVACSDDGPQNRNEAVDLLTEEFSSDGDFGFDRSEARCLAEAIVDTIGFERLDKAIRDTDGDIDEFDDELQFEFTMAVLDGMAECTDMSFLTE